MRERRVAVYGQVLPIDGITVTVYCTDVAETFQMNSDAVRFAIAV